MGHERAKITNTASQGMGQQTGGDELSNGREANTILNMISQCHYREVRDIVGRQSAEFLQAQMDRAQDSPQFTVSGKQLFWLRDIKDKLIAAGVL